MLPKRNRVRKGDFKKIFSSGKWIRTTNFNIVYTKDKERKFNQFTIVVGKKIGNAVERNQIKRIVREIFNSYKDKTSSPIQCIVMWRKPNPVKEDFESLESTLNKILQSLVKKE